MAEKASPKAEGRETGRKRHLARRGALLLVLVLVVAVLLAWFQRERIADDLIADTLESSGVEASYRIESIEPTRQVLTDLVIGDPDRPDLTVERVVVSTRLRFGLPDVTSVRLIEPRLFASYRDGEVSFGSLDPLIFTGAEGPFEFPDMALAVEDGRALVETDYGPVGVKLAGDGHLRGGFAGELAAVAPELALGDCTMSGTTLYGQVGIDAERPDFSGPLRFDRLACGNQGVMVEDGGLALDLRASRTLSQMGGSGDLRLGRVEAGTARLASVGGETEFSLGEEGLTARYRLQGTDLASPQVAASALSLDGLLRAREGFSRMETEGTLEGRAVRPAAALDANLAEAARAGEGTLVAPLVRRLRGALAEESRASTLSADYTARRESDRLSLVLPQVRWRGTSGQTLLSVSRAQLAAGGSGAPTLSANFATGGPGVPRIEGRFERTGSGGTDLRLAMAEYAAGEARLAVPDLALAFDPAGGVRIDGQVRASGPLPGGRARELALPVRGDWSQAGTLSLWSECTQLRFAALEVADLAFGREELTLCPPNDAPILRYDAAGAGLRLAAGLTSLDVTADLGETPVSLASGPVGLAYPGTLTARDVVVALGPPETATRFAVTDLQADLGEEAGAVLGGSFSGTDVFLNAVPLDLLDASGEWRYEDGRLTLSEGRFTLEDRQDEARFEPLVARDASLALEDNVITAEAALREPDSDALVTDVDIRHDLSSGTGFADLDVPGLTFGNDLQPVDLTPLALGVVANVDGQVTGEGRIDWSAESLTSTGSFSSEDLDFAAAFGPVRGASGTIEFTDLIGLTTAPRQRIALEAVNPGVEVNDGAVEVQVRGGEFIDLQAASWPFLGGTLTMRPLTIAIGVEEERGYILDVEGLEAALFVERMEIGNLSATGTFDGTIPVIFDADGNGRLEDGLLTSRPPGGNVSYVGQLTYEDMSPMVNYAFDALRSLDYREMRISMEGPLTGELVTRVNFEGISQGEGADSNFVTRELAKLPLRLVVNVRAPFYSLISSIRSLYDPSAVRDPRDLGLITAEGDVLLRETDQETVEAREEAAEEAEAADESPDTDIQPPESESVP